MFVRLLSIYLCLLLIHHYHCLPTSLSSNSTGNNDEKFHSSKKQHYHHLGMPSPDQENPENNGISALMLDVFLPGWRECIDWTKGNPSIKCVPLPDDRPEQCMKEIWDKGQEFLKQGKMKKCK